MQVEKVRQDFAPDVGDRRQELVFIGIDVNRPALSAALDACLATPTELAKVSVAQVWAAWQQVCAFEICLKLLPVLPAGGSIRAGGSVRGVA